MPVDYFGKTCPEKLWEIVPFPKFGAKVVRIVDICKFFSRNPLSFSPI